MLIKHSWPWTWSWPAVHSFRVFLWKRITRAFDSHAKVACQICCHLVCRWFEQKPVGADWAVWSATRMCNSGHPESGKLHPRLGGAHTTSQLGARQPQGLHGACAQSWTIPCWKCMRMKGKMHNFECDVLAHGHEQDYRQPDITVGRKITSRFA